MKNFYKLKILLFLIFLILSADSSNAQLNGSYTVGLSGDYPTISSAANDAVSSGVNGVVVFNILAGNYNERVFIDSIPGASAINTVTFQSQSGNQNDVVWYESVDFTTALVTLNKTDHIKFRNITFSNGASAVQQYAFKIQFDCEGISISNSSITCLSRESYGIFYDNASTKNLVIEENSINARTAIDLTGATVSTGTKIIRNNISRYEGILISNNDSLQIEENTINVGYLDPQAPGYPNAKGIILQNCNVYLKISKNKINSVGLPRYAQSKGVEITNSNCQNSLVVNNFIDYTGGGGLLVSGSNSIFIYYNSIHTGEDQYNFNTPNIGLTSCTNCIVKNNIAGGTDLTRINYASNTSLISDFNAFIPQGGSFLPPVILGYNGNEYYSVEDLNTATGLDSNSIETPVTFVSNINLHLAGASIGDEDLIAMPVAGITDDIDGNPRSPFFPYKGADEADIVLPVELNSFSSLVNGSDVLLNWSTASELNNSGFDIERAIDNGQLTTDSWSKIGNVNGNGTSTSGHSYFFTDRNLVSGKYFYRLKQIDFNGNFEYYNLGNEVVIGIPVEFFLSQNYPNPFNPNTNLEYGISELGLVTLKIYDISGKEVMTLVNEQKVPGYYSVSFNGANLSSGIYFYSIKAGDFISTKKMTLIK
jgi:hypothetical protein